MVMFRTIEPAIGGFRRIADYVEHFRRLLERFF